MILEMGGWAGFPQRPENGRAWLAAMLLSRPSAPLDSSSGTFHARLDGWSSLGQSGEPWPPTMAQNPPWCVIDGRPRWNERRLAELATREGDSAALLDGFARYGCLVLRFIGGRFRLAVVESRRALIR
jgi:hypothetical protein